MHVYDAVEYELSSCAGRNAFGLLANQSGYCMARVEIVLVVIIIESMLTMASTDMITNILNER